MTDSAEERDEFVQIYLEESSEELDRLVELLLLLEANPDDVDTLREAFRLLHTFKGSSGMMGYQRINALAHELETRFDACRSGRARMSTETVSVALRCVDFFQEFTTRLAAGDQDEGDPLPLIEALGSAAMLPAAAPVKPTAAQTVSDKPAAQETTPTAPPTTAAADQLAPVQSPRTTAEQSGDQKASDQKTSDQKTSDQRPGDQKPGDQKPGGDKAAGGDRQPIVLSTASRESGPARQFKLCVRLADQIELPELKARLIVARLQALGDVIGTEPPIAALDAAPHPITLRLQVRSASNPQLLIDSIDVEGVAAAYLDEPRGQRSGIEASSPPSPPDADPTIADQRSAGPTTADKAVAAEPPAPPSLPLPPPLEPAVISRGGETIRVGIDRLDRLMNLAGELVVTNARFNQLADEMRQLFRSGGSIDAGSTLADSLLEALSATGPLASEPADGLAAARAAGFLGDDGGSVEGAAQRRGWMERGRRVTGQVSETVDRLARLSRGIQQAVLETRMIPIGPMFNRFRRTVRDLAIKQNKRVLLDLAGEMTELDKRMVDDLGDPMMHLIRNAIDHGIESPHARMQCGKPSEGLIQLRAYHHSNHVVIEIIDDGAGIDAAKVRQRALQQGLATEAELQRMSDTEVYGYIWQPGFSTAQQVSDISGRGVGMDVVRDRIAALGGVVELDSRPGRGSTISIRLPLTLAIVNAMIVRFRGFRFAIPVTDIFEVHGLSPSEIFESQGREMIDVRGRLMPLYRLDELFQWNDHLPPAPAHRSGLVQAILVRDGHRSLAIEVDDLDGNSDIVIKSLDEHFAHVPGLGGACVMGDGEVCLVLDTASLAIKAARHRGVGGSRRELISGGDPENQISL